MSRVALLATAVTECRMKSGRHCCAGFSYIWTLMLVAILGVGIVLVAELWSTSAKRDKERELLFVGQQFRNAIGRYYESTLVGGAKQYPESLDVLLQDSRFPGIHRYLRRLYKDPITGKPEWGLLVLSGRIVGVHSLSEEKPIKVDNFDPTEASFKGKEHYKEWIFTYPADLVLVPGPQSTVNQQEVIDAKTVSTTTSRQVSPNSNLGKP
jgi:type II secretory pathway pseudopilin PulG